MKGERGKGFAAGVVVSALVFSLVGTAAATVGKRTAELDYNDIKLYINGQSVTPKDANGSTVEPFAINGTTYLPVRAVGDALGMNVNWDAKTNTVILGNADSSGANYNAIYLMGFFALLEDDFQGLTNHFTGFVDGTYKILGGEKIQSGPYKGMSYYDAMISSIDSDLDVLETHYSLCKLNNILTESDVQLMSDYRRLATAAKNGYTSLRENTSDMAITYVTGSALQNSMDSTLGESSASTRFWEVYRAA